MRRVPGTDDFVTVTHDLSPSDFHPERFGTLLGSVQLLGDADAPVVDPEAWTFDAENVGS